MKAAVLHSFHEPLHLEQVPVPDPGSGQVLVKVHASGVCETDLSAVDGIWPVKPKPPFIPGHEAAGVVVAVGRGVKNVREGDRVGVPWLHSACGECTYCVGGLEALCEAQQNSGYSVNGGFAEYVRAPAAYLAKIPASVGFADAAPVLCAGAIAYRGLKETGARPGEWVVITGLGSVGQMAVQYAKAMGLRVGVIDISQEKLSAARELGAEVLINAKMDEPMSRIRKQLHGAHAALITSISVCSSALRQAVGMLRRGGTCVLVDLAPAELPLPTFDLIAGRITIRGSTVGNRNDLAEALEFAAAGSVKAQYVLEPLENINSILERMREGELQSRTVMSLE